MGAVTTSLADRVTSIFDDLGYTVSGNNRQLRAERKWRVVTISLDPPDQLPRSGEFHCFVSAEGEAYDLYRDIAAIEPNYEWAILDVSGANDPEFIRPTSSGTDPMVT